MQIILFAYLILFSLAQSYEEAPYEATLIGDEVNKLIEMYNL